MLPRRVLGLIITVLLAALILAVAACGDDDDDGDTNGGAATTAPAETMAPAAGPGTVTLTSTAITGQSGKILLVFAQDNGQQIARACTPITSDDFTVSATVMTEMPAGNDPCGDETAEVTFDEGAYSLTAGVYVGGEQTPEASTTLSVTVAGDVTAELDGAALSQ